MSDSYDMYLSKKLKQAINKLASLLQQKKINRTQMIALLNRYGERVFKKERTQEIIFRVANRFSHMMHYIIPEIESIKALMQGNQTPKTTAEVIY